MLTINTPATPREAAVDAMLIRLSCPLLQFTDDGRPALDATGTPRTRRPSREALALSGRSVVDIGLAYLKSVGPAQLSKHIDKLTRSGAVRLLCSRGELQPFFPDLPLSPHIALSSTTGDFPGLMADSLNKLALSHFAMARRSWRAWARRGTARNFQQIDRVSVDAPALVITEPGAQISFASLVESPREVFQLATYTRGTSISRQAMLNDDTQSLRAAGELLANGAARVEDQLAYAVLTGNAAMADGYALFGSEHANTSTGALTAASLGTAKSVISKRLAADGNPIDWAGERLIVPSVLAETAAALLDSTANAARHETEPRVSMVSNPLLDLNSAAIWYLATDPVKAAAVEVAFLEGSEQPRIDTKTGFDDDAFMVRCVHDCAAAAVDYRGIVRSSGS
jgi:hypothetical protein